MVPLFTFVQYTVLNFGWGLAPWFCHIPMFERQKADASILSDQFRTPISTADIAWDRRKTDMGNARYLELADVALNPKADDPSKPESSVPDKADP